MFRVFDGKTADEVWQKVATAFRGSGQTVVQSTRNGPSFEILHAAISITNPRQRWVISRNPPINVAFALAEVIWIMTGRKDSAFLNYFNPQLPKHAGNGPTYHGAYGYRLRKHRKQDQLESAYNALSKNPQSRQVVLQIWDSCIDLPNSKGEPLSPDIPCNIVALLKVRDGALEWTQIMRSNDIFRGLPYNIVQFTSLQEIMSGWLGLKVGSYNHFSDSLHVYEADLEHVDLSQVIRLSDNTDSLALPKAKSDSVLRDLESRMNAIIQDNVTGKMLIELIENSDFPTPYQNILSIACAEGARKRQCYDLIGYMMKKCTNEAYHQLYTRWLSRFSQRY